MRSSRRSSARPTRETSERLKLVVEVLFGIFDTDGNGVVDFTELASGLSVLCGGSRDDKVKAAFALYDINGDGFISLHEMVTYLSSIFKLLFEVSPDACSSVSVSPEELAAATAEQAFSEADLNHDGKLSLQEFTAWYTQSNVPGSAQRMVVDSAPSMMPLQAARQLTKLESHSVSDVFHMLATAADEEGTLSRSAFANSLRPLMKQPESHVEAHLGEEAINRLFELFDADGNQRVDFAELASGLSVLCGGPRDDKVESAFALFDINGDGFISLEEMQCYLVSVFKVLYHLQPEIESRVGVGPDELGAVTAKQAFEDADLNHDGKISYDEFKRWSSVGEHSTRRWCLSGQASRSCESSPTCSSTTSWMCSTCSRRTPTETGCCRETFYACFQQLVTASGDPTHEKADMINVILQRLFGVFDADGNGVVDFTELASGLSVLCSGSREDKVRAAFNLFDVNGDGFISLDEMVTYLASVFRVLYETNPGTAERVGISADELATITARQAFEDADLNHDGRISLDEFTKWYSRNQDSMGGQAESTMTMTTRRMMTTTITTTMTTMTTTTTKCRSCPRRPRPRSTWLGRDGF